jgi:hypothetical protein
MGQDLLDVVEIDGATAPAERARVHADAAERLLAVKRETNIVKGVIYAKANVHATLALYYAGQA